jgi:hypothetical protein
MFNSIHCGFEYNNERPVKMRFIPQGVNDGEATNYGGASTEIAVQAPVVDI